MWSIKFVKIIIVLVNYHLTWSWYVYLKMMQFKTIYNKQTYLQSSSKGIITNLLALNLVAAMLVITATTFILFELKPFICFIDSYYYHVIQTKVENLQSSLNLKRQIHYNSERFAQNRMIILMCMNIMFPAFQVITCLYPSIWI